MENTKSPKTAEDFYIEKLNPTNTTAVINFAMQFAKDYHDYASQFSKEKEIEPMSFEEFYDKECMNSEITPDIAKWMYKSYLIGIRSVKQEINFNGIASFITGYIMEHKNWSSQGMVDMLKENWDVISGSSINKGGKNG